MNFYKGTKIDALTRRIIPQLLKRVAIFTHLRNIPLTKKLPAEVWLVKMVL